MAGRTRKTMVATAFGTEVTYQTAGDYAVAGVLMRNDIRNGFPLAVVAVGNSWDSVTRRTRSASRRERPGISRSDEPRVMAVVALREATAPVLREYFGTHNVAFDAWFTEERGWVRADGDVHAGRSTLRKMIADGAVAFHMVGRSRSGDFQAAELLKSMNSRKKAS
jgi:hypothetical protein